MKTVAVFHSAPVTGTRMTLIMLLNKYASYFVLVQLRIKELEDALEQERELRIRVSAEPK